MVSLQFLLSEWGPKWGYLSHTHASKLVEITVHAEHFQSLTFYVYNLECYHDQP